MKSRISTTLALGALAAGVLVGGTAPAASAAVPGASGVLSMWEHDSYQGQMEARSGYDADLHNDGCSGCDTGPGGNFGDDMSSYVNKTNAWWTFHTNTGYEGTKFCVRPNSHDADLGNNGWGNLEDEISSVQKHGTTRPANCDNIIGHAN